MIRIVLGALLAVVVNVAAADAATLIYGSSFKGPEGPASLYVFTPSSDPVIGHIGRLVGPIGFRRVGAIDFSPGGTLYGVGSDGATTVLVTIDTTTGAGTLVGPLGLGGRPFQDIAFRPTDGVLFGFATGDIFTIDTTTGAATLVGPCGLGFPFGNSLAFQGTTLYYANETALFTIDQLTGGATLVTNISYQPGFGTGTGVGGPPFPRPPAMKFDPVSGTLWASIFGSHAFLGTIDPGTGQTTLVNLIPEGTDGIAVTSGDFPATPVPTLSDWAQIVMVGVLILAGLAALRRRRSALG